MAAKFENFSISPEFPIILRKVTKFQRIISEALRVIDKNLLGVLKDPMAKTGLNVAVNKPFVPFKLMVQVVHVSEII